MAANSIGDFIRSVFSTMVNKNGTMFKALLADKNTSDGTIEKIFSDLEETRKAWTDVHSIYDMTGEMFEKTTALFSVLTMLTTDTEETYLNRLKLLFYRNGHEIWGSRYDILDIFKTFFGNGKVYIVNNTDDENFLKNGNFDKYEGWTLDNCSFSREARFEGTAGIYFNASGFLSQSVDVESSTTYFLHFFLKGNIRVKITDNSGRCWNPGSGETGGWANTEHYVSFASGEWDNKSIFFITDENVSSVAITFAYESGYSAYLDYARLNKKTGASTFSLIALFEGTASSKTAHFAPGKDDPIAAPADYKKYGYYAAGDEDAESTADGAKSYMDNAAIQEDVSPVLSAGIKDTEPLKGYENMSYNDETKAFAADSPAGSDDYGSVDYSKASYFDNAFIYGATGTTVETIYQELLDIVQPAGVTGTVETLVREADDE